MSKAYQGKRAKPLPSQGKGVSEIEKIHAFNNAKDFNSKIETVSVKTISKAMAQIARAVRNV